MNKLKRFDLIDSLIIDEVLSVEGLGLVSRLTEDTGGMTFVGLWLRTDKLKNFDGSPLPLLPVSDNALHNMNKAAEKNGEEL